MIIINDHNKTNNNKASIDGVDAKTANDLNNANDN